MVRHTEGQSIIDFLESYGFDRSRIYKYIQSSDAPSDSALFTLKDGLVAWRLLGLLRRNMAMIRSCVRWGPDGQVEVPLIHAEVPLASSALSVLYDQIFKLRQSCGRKEDHVDLLFWAVKEETIGKFMWVWEEPGDRYRDSAHIFESLPGKSLAEQWEILSRIEPDEGSEYTQSDWPTQWTVDFPLALQEYLGRLERVCEMLEAVCGTDRRRYGGDRAALADGALRPGYEVRGRDASGEDEAFGLRTCTARRTWRRRWIN